MRIGMSVIFQALDPSKDDAAVYRSDLALAGLAEPMGFDSIWGVEHHFSEYTMSPDVLQFLAFMAGRTTTIGLGSMVVVLPWHNPVRVAESVTLLDHLSGGRLTLGVGRGLGRLEFEGLGVPMDESRGRFGEAVELVMNALETGVAEHSGTYYQQERRQLRPAPLASFRGRTYAAAVSPESLEIIARLGVGLLVIPQKPWDVVIADVQTYRRVFREVNDTEPPPPILAGWVMCDEDEQRARVLAHRYIGAYYASVLRHYELAGRHFAETDGYEYYARMSRRLAVDGPDAATAFFVDLHPYGTPEQCLAKIEAMSASIGADTFVGVFGYGGMSDDEATQNLSLFHDRVMPGLRALRPEQAAVG